MSDGACRCGHSGPNPHPCHGFAYTCRQPSRRRFYGAELTALAGMQMKCQVSSTWACDACWERYVNDSNDAPVAQADRAAVS